MTAETDPFNGARDEAVFSALLERFYGGQRDAATLALS
jgi:uncharacterized protein (DUF1810 family)